MSQKEMVLDYIREFGSITPLDAFGDLGVTRLAAVIFELNLTQSYDRNSAKRIKVSDPAMSAS